MFSAVQSNGFGSSDIVSSLIFGVLLKASFLFDGTIRRFVFVLYEGFISPFSVSDEVCLVSFQSIRFDP